MFSSHGPGNGNAVDMDVKETHEDTDEDSGLTERVVFGIQMLNFNDSAVGRAHNGT